METLIIALMRRNAAATRLNGATRCAVAQPLFVMMHWRQVRYPEAARSVQSVAQEMMHMDRQLEESDLLVSRKKYCKMDEMFIADKR